MSSGGRLASLGLGLGLPEAQLAPVLLGHEAAVHPALEVILALLPTLTVLVVILRQANLTITVLRIVLSTNVITFTHHVLEVGHPALSLVVQWEAALVGGRGLELLGAEHVRRHGVAESHRIVTL